MEHPVYKYGNYICLGTCKCLHALQLPNKSQQHYEINKTCREKNEKLQKRSSEIHIHIKFTFTTETETESETKTKIENATSESE